MSESLTITAGTDLLWSPDGFAHGQRVAKMFSESALIPPHLRGKIADVTIALLLAKRMGEDPLVVMQSIYIVSGKAGWSAQYMIARANRSGIFRGRINWRVTGTGPTLNVVAFATLADTGDVVEIGCSMAMANAEGWTSNKKYQSMPELMLRYRSATMLVRLYAGDVMLGYSTVEELETLPPEVMVSQMPTGRSALGLPMNDDAIIEEAPVVVVAPVSEDKTRQPRNAQKRLAALGYDDSDFAGMSIAEMHRCLDEKIAKAAPTTGPVSALDLGWTAEQIESLRPGDADLIVRELRDAKEWRVAPNLTLVRVSG